MYKNEYHYTLAWHLLGQCGVICTYVLCFIPVPPSTQLFSYSDLVAHFLLFFCLSYWFAHLCQQTSPQKIILIFFFMGLSIEIIQFFLPYRSFELLDIFFDAFGGIAGVMSKQNSRFTPLKWMDNKIYIHWGKTK